MRPLIVTAALLLLALAVMPARSTLPTEGALRPGSRVLLDAHNAYPDLGRWQDRIDRALNTGLPLAIEQDLVWRHGQVVVSHGEPFDGREPTLDSHFFERLRPIMEEAIRHGRREQWPLVTLNLDFKTNEAQHHRQVWELLGRYEHWLTTAERTASVHAIASLRLGPMLVLTGDAPSQEVAFHDRVPAGQRLRVFGATLRDTPPRRTNYRRWTNHSWKVVEPEGQPHAADWSAEDEGRLTRLVDDAHARGLWIRFYTLNGHAPGDTRAGWSADYNFGSLPRASVRWRAAIAAGADFVAVDQYEEFAAVLARAPGAQRTGTPR